ncbi:MAG: LCP family protein [Cyanobacteriota bacterium]|nr:LCP family protein [Cyanobacteriota bacterium]
MSSFPHPRRAGSPRSFAFEHWLLWLLFGFTAVFAGTAGALVAVLLPQQIMPQILSPADKSAFRDDQLRAASLDYSLNILVLGVDGIDSEEDQQTSHSNLPVRSDTLLFVRFNPDSNKIALLSIPRDTRVPIPGYGTQKINAAHALGGPALTARVVSQMLGDIPIDRYVRLNSQGIAALIDAVGGVEVYVSERMKYTDVTQKLYIDLEPGLQRLNGEQAHQFVRFRQDALGDIGRVQRQQQLMRALSLELLKPTTWAKAPVILQAVRDNLDTNLTWEELLSLAKFMLTSGQDSLDMVLLPGRFSQPYEYSTSYWLPDPEGVYQIAVNYFDAQPSQGDLLPTPPNRLRIAVQNATGQAEIARKMAQELRNKGFTSVFAVEDAHQMLEQTQIIAQQGDLQGALEVQSLLGLGQTIVESTGTLDSDITIKVGQDWLSIRDPLQP